MPKSKVHYLMLLEPLFVEAVRQAAPELPDPDVRFTARLAASVAADDLMSTVGHMEFLKAHNHPPKVARMPKAARTYAAYYRGYDPDVSRPEGGYGAHVFAFPHQGLVDDFLGLVGGAPHPTEPLKTILTR